MSAPPLPVQYSICYAILDSILADLLATMALLLSLFTRLILYTFIYQQSDADAAHHTVIPSTLYFNR